MKRKYTISGFLFLSIALLLAVVSSCKKDNNGTNNNTTTTTTPTPTQLGLYLADSSVNKLMFIDVSTVGTQQISDGMVFDTGSGGMVLDAEGILPKSMITSTGFSFTGDSVVYDGITITNDTSHIEYGDDANTSAYVYGNLAYANVVIDQEGGNVTIKRLPFFLYYKAVDGKGNLESPHEFDVFGVNEEYDVTFKDNNYITSPFTYYTPATGLTKGFKIAPIGSDTFSLDGTYNKNVVTLGLTAADLSSNGFDFTALTSYPDEGYPPIVSGKITYNNKTINSYLLFDSGTEPDNYIEDNTANGSSFLAANSTVAVSLSSGFNYDFTVTNTDYITYVENPESSDANVSVFSIEYFLKNEYMLDFADHKLGVKNN
jgi:hypothetical protein